MGMFPLYSSIGFIMSFKKGIKDLFAFVGTIPKTGRGRGPRSRKGTGERIAGLWTTRGGFSARWAHTEEEGLVA